jgi:hypothetical protein
LTPRHDGLAGARVVSQQKSQRLARQHLLVDCCDLVGQRLNQRSMDGENRIEEMRQSDAVRLGDEPKQLAIAVEAPWLPLLRHLEARFIGAVQDLVADPPGRVLVGELEGVVAVPLNVDDGDQRFGKNAAYSDVGLEVFEFHDLGEPIVSATVGRRGSDGCRPLILSALNMRLPSISPGSHKPVSHCIRSCFSAASSASTKRRE